MEISGANDGFDQPSDSPERFPIQLWLERPPLAGSPSFFFSYYSVPYNPLGYQLTTRDGLTDHFGQSSGMEDIADRNANMLTFTRDAITSSLRPSITFKRDGQGRIIQITDPNGELLEMRRNFTSVSTFFSKKNPPWQRACLPSSMKAISRAFLREPGDKPASK